MAMLMGEDNPLGALIGKNAAEKALQPWWEGIQDLLIYGLIGLIFMDRNVVNKPMVFNHKEPASFFFVNRRKFSDFSWKSRG